MYMEEEDRKRARQILRHEKDKLEKMIDMYDANPEYRHRSDLDDIRRQRQRIRFIRRKTWNGTIGNYSIWYKE